MFKENRVDPKVDLSKTPKLNAESGFAIQDIVAALSVYGSDYYEIFRPVQTPTVEQLLEMRKTNEPCTVL